jgi:hypothetical protein
VLYGQAQGLARFFHGYRFIGKASIGFKGCAQLPDVPKLMNWHGDGMAHFDCHVFPSNKQEFYAPIEKTHDLFGCAAVAHGVLVTKSS